MKCRLQILIRRLVADDMEQRDNGIERPADVDRANIPTSQVNDPPALDTGGAVVSMGHRHHVRAAFDAMDIEPKCREELAMAAGAGSEFEDVLRAGTPNE